MPEIKIKHIVSFSSEDKVHKAENILKAESYRKWKCATSGEKNASIVLQFEKATKIHSIDIGNECSAFVEVLVGRSSDSVNDFQVLLVASSFMSPLESRNENHTNRVRMFDVEKLSQNLKDEKWDCVQVVCTQPFNKNISYGLSFIKFHSPPEKNSEQPPETETKTATTKLGAFQLKYDDDDEDTKTIPGVSWKQNRDSDANSSNPSSQEGPSYAAAVLASTSQSKPVRSDLSDYEKKVLKNKQEQLAFIKALKIQEAKQGFAEAVKEVKANSGNGTKKPVSTSTTASTPLREKNPRVNSPRVKRAPSTEELRAKPPKRALVQNPSPSTSSHSNKVAKVDTKRPFHKILDKVVFVISGFVNPLRSEIRDKALEMGAKYKGDWDRTCTHLVCAFINTPKYIQVRADDGRIVTKEWVLDCYRKKALLPWRSYMLGKYSKDSSDEQGSDEETGASVSKKDAGKLNGNHSKNQPTVKRRARIASSSSDSDEAPTPSKQSKSLFEEVNQKDEPKPGPSSTPPKPKATNSDSDSAGEKNVNSKADRSKGKSSIGESNGGKIQHRIGSEDSETEDEEAIRDYVAATDVESDSGGDTEDEIRKVEQAQKKKVAPIKSSSPQENFSDSEDSSSLLSLKPDTTHLPLPELPNLFKKRHFYMYGEFPSKKRHDLQRFITAYNGVIDDYMGDTVKYVVTEEGWDKNFEDALEENEDLIFVKPEWIFKCHEAQKLVPYQAFIVIPS